MSSEVIVKAVPCFGDVCDADYRFFVERGTLLSEMIHACKDTLHELSNQHMLSAQTLVCTQTEKGDYTAEILDSVNNHNPFMVLPF
ncbi:MAG: hypothetical protein ACO3GR_00590 [Candidatus Kapaibacteriota bacterium]